MRKMPKSPGRPPLPDDDRRTDSFPVRLSAKERRLLQLAADRTGIKLSRLIREAALRDALHVDALAKRMGDAG